MGLCRHSLKFLKRVRDDGISFDTTAMIGRQWAGRTFAEEVFASLGAQTIHSFDISDYEGADHLHDFNLPISTSWHNQYSLVLDGGTLEHVFNFPQAVKNCMEMVRVGGHYIGLTPVNGWAGHGFYQFSPCLFESLFTYENGYRLICLEKGPRKLYRRTRLLYVVAKRMIVRPVLSRYPQQSDYARKWKLKSHHAPVMGGIK